MNINKPTVMRVHMGLGKEGVTLAMAGAANSEHKSGNHKLKAASVNGEIGLATVGGASQKS